MRKRYYIRKDGYILLNGYGLKCFHRIIMENLIGRELDVNEVVHHIDGNVVNNSPDNLQLITRGDHKRLHALGHNNLIKDIRLLIARKIAREIRGISI